MQFLKLESFILCLKLIRAESDFGTKLSHCVVSPLNEKTKVLILLKNMQVNMRAQTVSKVTRS